MGLAGAEANDPTGRRTRNINTINIKYVGVNTHQRRRICRARARVSVFGAVVKKKTWQYVRFVYVVFV